MPTSDDDTNPAGDGVAAPGATVLVEAATAEAALAEVHERLGPDARIVEAERVRRGGVAGFFAREVVHMHAAPGAGVPEAGAQEPQTQDAPPAPIDRLIAEARTANDAIDFATFLRAQIASPSNSAAGSVSPSTAPATPAAGPAPSTAQPVGSDIWTPARLARAAAAAPTPIGEVPAQTPVVAAHADATAPGSGDRADEGSVSPDPAPHVGGPMWSETALVRLGLPPELVRSIALREPGDDVAWTYGLATVLRPLCRPLPVGRSLLVGPRARGLARQLGVQVVAAGEPLRVRGDAAATVSGGAGAHDWLERANGKRWLHLVAGGSRWRELLAVDPLALSWAVGGDLVEAVRCAYELGLVLGYGPLESEVGRARPMDVALAIRAQVPRR